MPILGLAVKRTTLNLRVRSAYLRRTILRPHRVSCVNRMSATSRLMSS